jgi:adenylosuccinate synthase
MTNLHVVVGAQYGSEAKGHVTAQIIKKHSVVGGAVANVRVAGPNAGHSVVDESSRKWALRQVPVGAVFTRVPCVIAAGSEIDPSVLLNEIDSLRAVGHLSQGLYVDEEATVLEPHHIQRETGMHERMGSTGKGIGAARADRIMRQAKRVKDHTGLQASLGERGVRIVNTAAILTGQRHLSDIVIEGTQGYGLGLHAGHYPQCTSSDCRAIDFLSMVGLSPWGAPFHQDNLDIWAVARVYPIRVAGNSGPLKNETTWEELGLPEELTTVTQKVRRVGLWDDDLIRSAVAANGGAPAVRVALTMLDQRFPEIEGMSGGILTSQGAPDLGIDEFIKQVEADAQARVRMITTSDRTAVWL